MASFTSFVLVLCLGLALQCTASPSGAFRGSGGPADAPTVTATEVETSLQEVFDALKVGGRGAGATELARVEASIWQTFQSLPKNGMGRLLPPAVRYIVHNYFAKEHGWILLGLEPTAATPNVSDLHGASILQDRAPAFVEALLESRRVGAGLALDDVVAMVATLEHLVLHESVSFLEASYRLNGMSSLESLQREELDEVIISYVTLFGQGSKADLSDAQAHQKLKAFLKANASAVWKPVVEHTNDAVMNYDYARRDVTNPFGPNRYSFDMAVDLAQGLAHGYGKWQNKECVDMKDALVSMDPSGNGRVPLGTFYSGAPGSTWHFSESVDMLRQLGALDETARGGPQVLIANYMAQPANCIATSAYYSVCCLNECQAVTNEIEHAVQAPTASADRLLGIVGNISTATVDAPRGIPRALAQKLQDVAASQGGEVALHGRLFSQWLHFAFPSECAYPHTEEAGVVTAHEWLVSGMAVDEVTAEDRQRHVAVEKAAQEAKAAALAAQEQSQLEHSSSGQEDDGLSAWRDEERYHVNETSAQPWAQPKPQPQASRGGTPARRVLRLVAQLVALAVVAKTAWSFLGAQDSAKTGQWSDQWSDPKAWGGREVGQLPM